MRRSIEHGPEARADLFEIWNYVAHHNRRAADELIRQFNLIFQTLAENPMIGRARDELEPGLRSFPYRRYIVFYNSSDTKLAIIRILSSYRDIGPDSFA
ncbi:MAG TPA: type II toxin-antitoxin system RelE/ParE family toxin [Devosiaceae bacterium]|nr:type II toxin-antitoxin system RelE/ParE family toxin [Devosiaceae bacterium]